MRIRKACDRCRLRKTKCTGDSPCAKCSAEESICTFTTRRQSRQKRVISRDYVELIESQLEAVCNAVQQLSEDESLSGRCMTRPDGSKASVGELLREISARSSKVLVIDRKYEPISEDEDDDTESLDAPVNPNSSKRHASVAGILRESKGRHLPPKKLRVIHEPTESNHRASWPSGDIMTGTFDDWASLGMPEVSMSMAPSSAVSAPDSWNFPNTGGTAISDPAFDFSSAPRLETLNKPLMDLSLTEESSLGDWTINWPSRLMQTWVQQ